MNKPSLPTYHNIISSVRTPKAAILVNTADTYWKDTILRIVEWCTQVWGGEYNIIVPTDGKTIDKDFWTILEKYSPDYIFSYRYTIADLESADTKKYDEIINVQNDRLKKQFPTIQQEQIDDFIKREVIISDRLKFEISDELSQELKHRLSPFFFRDHVIGEKVSAKPYVPFPLTDITKIIKNTDINRVVIPDYSKDKDVSLLLYSVFGKATRKYEESIHKENIKVDYVSSKVSVYDLLEIAIKKKVDIKDYEFREQLRKELHTKGSKPVYPNEDFLWLTPFATSMLKLGKYTLRDDRSDLAEDTTVFVIGDALSDFCLYYCLSRLNKNICWLPKKFIDAGKAAIENKKGNKLYASIASTVARSVFSIIHFGLNDAELHLVSISCDKSTLEQLKPTLVKLMLVDEPRAEKSIVICNLKEEHLRGILHVIEQNNYANQHTETFIDFKSVGFIPTPKPKNFNLVDPAVHRWITVVNVDGYIPPPLYFLDEKIVLTGISSYPTRVSKYGLCYVSPNIGYFGGDTDTNSMRPKLGLVEALEIFRGYFRDAGYEDIRISDKGGYSASSLEKFGSLDAMGAFFSIEKNRNLMDKFLITSSSCTHEQGEIVYMETIKRTFLDFHAIACVLGSENDAITLIDDFIEKKIFYRGIALQCLRCRNSDWYDLYEIQREFKCKRCDVIQIIKQKNWKDGNEPKWFYKLDEVIYQGVSNDMHVPILTLYSLKKKSNSSFLYIPEIEIRKKTDQKKCDMEIDTCCIVDGDIVIGESKKASIKPDEVKKYEELTKSLKRYPDKVIFSSFQDGWSEELKNSITEKFNNVSFLFKSDLST